MIVAITGLLEDAQRRKRIAGAGKDEAAKVLVENGFVSVAFADIMKRWCKELYGFTDEQLWGTSSKRTEPDKRYTRFVEVERDNPALAPLNLVKPVGLTPRYALQKLGDWGRDCFMDIWANKALEIIKDLSEPLLSSGGRYTKYRRYNPQVGIEDPAVSWNREPFKGAVIPDCRFQSEFERVKEEGGHVIRVKRLVDEFPDVMDDSHVSERDILEWGDDKFDHVIVNNGTVEELHYAVSKVLGLPVIKFPQVVSY